MAGNPQSYGVMLARQMVAHTSGGGDRSDESSLDFSQALNTALCFLAWMNVDAAAVETFLRRWPEALLLEGSHQDCARCIVLNRMKQGCSCGGLCNKNRQSILDLMSKGFQYYQHKHIQDLVQGKGVVSSTDAPFADLQSTTVFPQLMATGRYLRGLAAEESSVHSQLVETNVARVMVERELERAQASSKRMKARVISLFTCGIGHKKEKAARTARLEFDLEMAQLKYESVKKEHKLLVKAIDEGHRNQYALLKGVFVGCKRHDCTQRLAMNRVNSILDRSF